MTRSVKKYGQGWRIRWEAGERPDGSRNQRSKGGFATKREAEQALREQLELVRRGRGRDVSKMTVGEFLDEWLSSKHRLREATRRAYAGHIRVYLKPHIGRLRLQQLDPYDLDRMYDDIRAGQLRKPPGPATMRRIHATLRTALNSAYKRRLIDYNPAGQVELEPEPIHRPDVWDQRQLATFLTAAANDELGPALRLIAMTGLRRGECCGLRWSDVDLEDRTITVSQQLTESGGKLEFGAPKTRQGARVIGLDPATVAVLRIHRANQNATRLALGPGYQNSHDLVFCEVDGAPLHPERLSRRFLSIAKRAGLPRIVLHGLRHSHATHALAAGVDLKVVSNRLGHARSSFTADTYMRVLPEVDRRAADLVAESVRAAGAGDSGGGP